MTEIKEIGFTHLEIGTRKYRVIGWSRKHTKSGRPKIDKDFIEVENIPLGDPMIHHGGRMNIPHPLRVYSTTHYKEILDSRIEN